MLRIVRCPGRAAWLGFWFFCACSAIAETGESLVACTDPRPEMCTYEYNPVCALRDTGIRCITTPCESEELKTYGNACAACSDKKVNGYYAGACEKSS